MKKQSFFFLLLTAVYLFSFLIGAENNNFELTLFNEEKSTLNSDLLSFSPLADAVARGNIEAFDILMANDDNTSLLDEVDGLGNLLHVSIYFWQQNMLKHLFEKYNDKVKNLIEDEKVGKTPLMLAAELGNLEAITLLKNQGVDLNKGTKEYGRTAVHFAAESKRRASIKLLHYLETDLSMPDYNLTLPHDLIETRDDFESRMTYNMLINLINSGDREQRRAPTFVNDSPLNLVFSGGGVNLFSFIGALKELQKKYIIDKVKRVAGVSTGSIIATLVAVGYTPDEIEQLVPLDLFDRLLVGPSSCEKRFAKIGSLQEFFMTYKLFVEGCINHDKYSVKSYLSDWLFQKDVGCNPEGIRLWIEHLIKDKTGKEYCTFGELQELVANDKRGLFKDLHIFASQINGSSPEVHRFSSEDPKHKNLIISDVLTAAISIPVIFEPQLLFYKDEENERYSKNDDLFIDGDLFYTFLITVFDERQYIYHRSLEEWEKNYPIFNVRTLGFSSEKIEINFDEEKEITTIYELLKFIGETWWNMPSSSLIKEMTPEEIKSRTIYINLEDIKDMEFSNFIIDRDTKKELINLGAKAARKLCDDDYQYFQALLDFATNSG